MWNTNASMKKISDKARILHLGGSVKEISPQRAWRRGEGIFKCGMANRVHHEIEVESDIIVHSYKQASLLLYNCGNVRYLFQYRGLHQVFCAENVPFPP
jgi:hypothetical protein